MWWDDSFTLTRFCLLGGWIALASLIIFLSARPTLNLISKKQTMNRSYDGLHLVSTYGALGSISQVRHELIFEGTDRSDYLSPDAVWKEYAFKGKPGDPDACPPLVAPYHHRLGWPKAWWRRSSMGIYLDPVSLETAGLKRILRYYDWLPRSERIGRSRGVPRPKK